MSSKTWIIVDSDGQLGAGLSASGADGGSVTALVVGTRERADAAAEAVGDVRWVDPGQASAEAWAGPVAELVAGSAPAMVIASPTPASRVLLGRIAARLGAVVLGGVVRLADIDEQTVRVQRRALSGRLLVTATVPAPVCVFVEPSDAEPPALAQAGTVSVVEGSPAAVASLGVEQAPGGGSGVTDAARVVSVGRGLRAKDDLRLIEKLASALDARVGCSMPVADDLGWVPKADYVGRSGQHIAPRLYLALGISGAPQHLEGIRDAKTVVAINSDKDAPIFSRADYGIVGDLYDVVPELIAAVGE